MAPTVASSLSDFLGAVSAIGVQLLNSVIAVFTAIFALGKDILGAFLQLGQSIFKLGVDLFQGVFGFVIGEQPVQNVVCFATDLNSPANFFLLAIIGGGYYFYTQRQGGTRTKRKV